jgi:serine/threonine-protein kinase
VNTCPSCGDRFDDDLAFCPKDGARLSVAGGDGDLVGTVIADRYRITSKVGGGGMGQVYKAEHVRMKRTCAIKVLRGNLAGDREATQRFQREAENASQLSHPNVAQIYDFGEHGKLVYLAMEFIEGESLAALLQREPAVHPDVAADIIAQSAAALEAAHARGVLHRDVKPDNIMLARNPDGTYLVKLVDFGIARAMTSDEQRVTRTGLVIGTPEFMSPEQIAGETLDGRSDLYALALVAFQCVTGKEAFPATSSKQNLIMRLTSRPRTLLEVRADVPWPAPLQAVFDRALAPDPADRYDSVGQFAEELWTAIGSMAPSETAELYRRALEQRVVSVSSRTPQAASLPVTGAARTGAAAGGTVADVPLATQPMTAPPQPFAPATMGRPEPSPTSSPTPPRAYLEQPPVFRQRPRLMPWLLAIGIGGWAFLAATGRTGQARAVVDTVVTNLAGLIGTTRKLADDDPSATERAARRAPTPTPSRPAADGAAAAEAGSGNDGTARPGGGAPSVDSSALEVGTPAPTPAVLPVTPTVPRAMRADSVQRPPVDTL